MKDIVKRTKKVCIDTTFAYPLIIKSGYGCYIEDTKGKLYLDFNSNVFKLDYPKLKLRMCSITSISFSMTLFTLADEV